MTSPPRILPTVAGSYPVPEWLAARPIADAESAALVASRDLYEGRPAGTAQARQRATAARISASL